MIEFRSRLSLAPFMPPARSMPTMPHSGSSPRRRIAPVVALGLSALAAVALAAHEPPPTLVYPVDLVAAEDGWLVADFKAHGLLRLAPDGAVEPVHQGPGMPRTPLYGTRAVVDAPDGDGWLVADPGTFGLYRVDAAGELSTLTTELDIPQGLVRFDDESVLVSDLRSGIGAVMRVTLDGRVTVFAEVDSPKGIVADGEDAFAVVSHGERAVFRLARDGGVTTLFRGEPLDFPHDLVRDPDGSLVVTDGYASALFRIDPEGGIETVAQGPPLVVPQGIVRDADGSYVVVDPRARAVFRVGTDGTVEEIAPVTGE